ncbi:hypothetical protein FNO01nite_26690 [Flavobacterium noncentrifugens]|uniref:Por secretion system C-terminal sorting domain-containing protein n=1 Tax=Flavobacterium noncentrifugens TaxID=1128970 RepID=A0A1G9CDF4_9FLAO|nr:T9SS type A sorting domain-containing protein [Flavobacterium noncentrifugens]GEP51997.1 hypothetical protein FNO01nite_26690 [Flavobacterium noncentrifugens]SDK49703.1 Por secretion system C-terminal sorting domain-containing protein [Flavobacterium noncentrifugens]
MKQFYIFILIAFAAQFSQAQPEVLFSTQWKLTYLAVGSESYIPVSNSEVVQVPLQFSTGDFAPTSMSTSVCNTGFGFTEFSSTEPTFSMGEFGRTLIMCNLPENESMEGRYFSFFSENIPGIFTYEVTYLLDFSYTPMLTITNPDGDYAQYTDANLAAKSFTSEKFTISPNPATDYIAIDFGNKTATNATVEIYDTSGKRIRTENLSASNTINVQNLAKGIYFLKLKNGDAASATKFIKI